VRVQAINTTLSLGPHKETTVEDVAFEEVDDKFTVYVSRTSNPGRSIHLHICKELERILEVDMMTLFSCITHPVDMVNSLFEFKGIEMIPVDDGHDTSWLQSIKEPSVPIIPTSDVSGSPEPPPSSPPRSPTALTLHDADHFPQLGTKQSKPVRDTLTVPSSPFQQPLSNNGRSRQRSSTNSSVGPSVHSQYMPPSSTPSRSGSLQPIGQTNNMQEMNRLAAQAAAMMNVNHVVPNSLAQFAWPLGPVSPFNPPVPTDETDMVGIMGEHYVRQFSARLSWLRTEEWE